MPVPVRRDSSTPCSAARRRTRGELFVRMRSASKPFGPTGAALGAGAPEAYDASGEGANGRDGTGAGAAAIAGTGDAARDSDSGALGAGAIAAPFSVFILPTTVFTSTTL